MRVITKWSIATAFFASLSIPIAASASSLVSYRDTKGCTHTVYAPTITVVPGPPGPGRYTLTGGFGESVTCP
jgi:hypothetical protein